MASGCCVCRAEFSMYRRRHHCRTCGRVVCDDCSSNRINRERTCTSCWDRLGRRMSGLGLPGAEDAAAAIAAASTGRGRRSALAQLLEEDRYNQEFVMADGRKVSYSVAGVPDGLPVFLFMGLDGHRHSAAHFEEVSRRQGLRLICIDRPGRGKSDPIPVTETPGDGRDGEQGDTQAAVVQTVKEMCAKLRIETAGVLGQSLGAIFALQCASDADLKDVLDGTAVCLVSPWVPLAAPGCQGALQKLSALSKSLKGTMGRLGGETVARQVGELALSRGSSGASEIEKGYLEAPYTQELIRHVAGLKEGRASVATEALIALRNEGEEEAKERCRRVLHPVRIWHGRSDQLVPYEAMKWLGGALSDCESSAKMGGTHALMYDRGEMEHVFAALHKTVSEARAKARFSARRLSRRLSYVASSVFPTAESAPAAPAQVAGQMSPRTGKKEQHKPNGEDIQSASSPAAEAEKPQVEPADKLRDRLSRAFSKPNMDADPTTENLHGGSGTGSQRTAALSPDNPQARPGSTGSGGGLSGNSGSGHASSSHSGHGVGAGVGSSSSGHGGSWHGAAADHSGHGRGVGNSLHGSDAPPSIPEEGEMPGWEHNGGGKAESDGGSLLGAMGLTVTRALSGAFSSQHGSVGSGAGVGGNVRDVSSVGGGHSRSASEVSVTSLSAHEHHRDSNGGSEGLFYRGGVIDRAISTLSASGSTPRDHDWSGSAHDVSGHGSISSVGGLLRNRSGSWGGSWGGSAHGKADASQGQGNHIGGFRLSMQRAFLGVGPSPAKHGDHQIEPQQFAKSGVGDSTPVLGGLKGGSRERAAALKGLGYEAAMADWPAGKVLGEPAWEEWSAEKKLFCHAVVAAFVALVVAIW